MNENIDKNIQEKDKKRVKLPKFPKFYVLCDRQYYGLEYDDDPRSSKAEVFYEDTVTKIFENEDEYVYFMKTQVVTDYAGLPMKHLCCKHFMGLDVETISNICKGYNNIEMIERQCEKTKRNYKEENFKDYIEDPYVVWRDKLYDVVKYVNLFDETSNEVIGKFILSHIYNNKFYDLELTKIRHNKGWFYDISNYHEIVKDRRMIKNNTKC